MKWQLALIGAAILRALGKEAEPTDLMASPIEYRLNEARLEGDLDDEDEDESDVEHAIESERRQREKGRRGPRLEEIDLDS